MVKVRDIEKIMEELAPQGIKEPWDNVGLQIGGRDNILSGILLALDLTDEVISEAEALDCNMIITHHPLIFAPLKRITEEEPEGRLAIKLIKKGINFIAAHTNLDKAEGGVNDCLAERLGLIDVTFLGGEDGEAIARIGTLPEAMSLKDFAIFCKDALGASGVRYSGAEGKRIKTVALCSGAGSDLFTEACENGADAFVTGEVKHHHALYGAAAGISFVEAGHFETENIVLEAVADALENKIDIPVHISEAHKPVLKMI